MTRIFGLLSGSLLVGSLFWSGPALAQGGGDVMEEEPSSEDPGGSDVEDDDGGDDGDDGGWDTDSTGGGESGFHFGLRLAWGIPMGDVSKATTSTTTVGGVTTTTTTGGGKLSDGATGQIPIWLDLGWQFTPSFMVGMYFSYGFVILDKDITDECDQTNSTCSANDIRLGLQAQLSFAPGKSVDPWLGAGVGYEWLSFVQEETTARSAGWELPMLQGGIDFGGDSGGSTVGPFVAFTMSKFTRYKYKQGSASESGDIENTATHNWIFLGVRGVVK